MKKNLLLVGIWIILLSLLFVVRSCIKPVMPAYPVLSNLSIDYVKNNKQQISDEFIKVLKDEEKALDNYIADTNVSNKNKDKAFLKHMNNVYVASNNLSNIAILLSEDLATPQENITIVKTFLDIKYCFKSTLLKFDDEQFYSYTEPENPITLLDYPMVRVSCLDGGEECGAIIDTNYYINKYQGKISEKTLQKYSQTEDLSSFNFNETNVFIGIINIALIILTIYTIKMLWGMYGKFIPVKKWGQQWLNSIVNRFSTMKLWYKIILVISGIAFIWAYILSSHNINYQPHLLVTSILFCFLLLTKGIVLRFIVAYFFAKMTSNFCAYMVFAVVAYIVYILFHIAMKFAFKYIKSKVDLDYVKSFFTKQTIIAMSAIIGLICIVGIYKSQQLPQCDSKFAEKTVIQIFEQNDMIYEHNIDNVATIKMSNFTPMNYDRDINKYSCTAELTMYAHPDTPIYFLGAYRSFKYNVSYVIYRERGENKVRASWEMLNIGAQEFAR